jgi:ABC-2 type transport system permease protein
MRELLLVLNVKSAVFLKGIFRLGWQSVFKNVTSLLIFGGFALGTFIVARAVTAYLLETAHIGSFLFHRFLSMILYVLFVTVNIGNLIVCYASLYRSEEVNFLMSLPISHAKIFLIRFVDNFFYSSSTLALIGLSAILGYGSYFDMPWYFYFFSILFVFLPFMLIAAISAVITLLALIRIAARIGVRLLIGAIIAVYLGAVYVYFNTTNPVGLVSSVMEHYPDVNSYFGNLDPPLVRYLPNHWVTEFLYWSVNGNYERATPHFLFLFFTMFGLIAIAGLLARKYYYRTWLTASDAAAMRASKFSLKPGFGFFSFGRSSFLERLLIGQSPQREVVFKRDFWTFFRDPGQWLHFLLMIILMLVFLISVSSLEVEIVLPLMRTVSFLVVFLFNGFLIASIALRFVFPAVSLEGRSFWAVRTSPLDLKSLYFHKLAYAFGLTFLAVEVLTFGSIPRVAGDGFLLAVAAITGGCTALALTSLHLGAGTYFARYREKNPVRIASTHGASLAFLGSMAYLGILILVLVGPLHAYYQDMLLLGAGTESGFFAPVAIITSLSVVISVFSTRIGLRSIAADLI